MLYSHERLSKSYSQDFIFPHLKTKNPSFGVVLCDVDDTFFFCRRSHFRSLERPAYL